MTALRIIAASSVVIAAGLAGCAPGSERDMQREEAHADYMSSGSYMRDSSVGRIMTTPEGRTVYTFDQDSPGVSNCYDACAVEWPPVTAASDAQPFGEMTIVTRSDGTRQWAYQGKPLYLYHDDTKPGDVDGEGDGGVWHVVR
jgi:predicted lipoprotein with Yx(FWY)xxD motif